MDGWMDGWKMSISFFGATGLICSKAPLFFKGQAHHVPKNSSANASLEIWCQKNTANGIIFISVIFLKRFGRFKKKATSASERVSRRPVQCSTSPCLG